MPNETTRSGVVRRGGDARVWEFKLQSVGCRECSVGATAITGTVWRGSEVKGTRAVGRDLRWNEVHFNPSPLIQRAARSRLVPFKVGVRGAAQGSLRATGSQATGSSLLLRG